MTRKRQASKPEPEHYDDPLGLDDPVLPDAAPPAGLIVTGLSDEDDAARLLAQQFDPDLMFCTNCETPQDKGSAEYIGDVGRSTELYHCAYCGCGLAAIGTPPRKRKFR